MKLTQSLLTSVLKGTKTLDKGRYGDGRNLYLVVSSSTAMSWVFIFTKDGKRYDLGLGSFTGAGRAARLSLAEARAKADELRVDLAKGQMPESRKTRKAKKDNTFATVYKRWLVDAEKGKNWKLGADGVSNQRRALQSSMEQHGQSLMSLPVADITRDHVLAVIKDKWPSPTMDKLRSQIERVLDTAKVEGLRSGDNPATWKGNLEKLLHGKPETKSNHASMDGKDLPPFFAKLLALDTTESRSLAWVILTATRTEETREMKWSEIDRDHEEGPRWTIPASRIKTSNKKGVGKGAEHIVPLTSTMLAILDAQPKVEGNDYVWAGKNAGKPVSDSTHKTQLRRLGVTSEQGTVHGFRSTFSDWVGDHPTFGHDTETREFALAHNLNAVTGAYRRKTAVERRRIMMQAWDNFCVNKTNVVPMLKAA